MEFKNILNMNILDPSDILDKDRALNFINYDAITRDNRREGIIRSNLWMIPSLVN